MSDMMKAYGYSSDEFDFDPRIFKSKRRHKHACHNGNGKPKTRKERVFHRDGYQCLRCGSRQNLTLDHITPKSWGGGNGINNLQTLCGSCNKVKGSKNNKDYRRK